MHRTLPLRPLRLLVEYKPSVLMNGLGVFYDDPCLMFWDLCVCNALNGLRWL